MTTRKGGAHSPSFETSKQQRYCAWFHELDAWTEYWDLYHPETRGRFYFGDGNGEPGLLRQFVPREHRPASFLAWRRKALLAASDDEEFANQIRVPDTAAAIMEVDVLLAQLFTKRFGD